MSLTPAKRSHSACAQGGINSVNDLTRQLGDAESKHFDDTVYGGDFLQHQPPVKELADWAPRIIELMDRLGVTFNRTPEGFRDQRRFGGTLYKRTAFAGATTGQQLLYALDEQVRRWQAAGRVAKFEGWDFLGPIVDSKGPLPRVRRAGHGQHADPRHPGRRGHRGQRRVRRGVRPLDQFDRLHRQRRRAASSSPRRSLRQRGVRPGSPHRRAGGRQAPPDQRECPGRGRPRLGAPHAPGSTPAGSRFPKPERYYFPRRPLPHVRQPRPPRHRHPRNLQGVRAARGSVSRPTGCASTSTSATSPASCWTGSWPASWKSTKSSRASILAGRR